MNALPRTLSEARREFLRHRSPRILIGCVVISVVLRLLAGNYRWSDLIAVAILFIAMPFIEWTVHVFVLHDKPHQIGPFTYDTVLAKEHRRHHADPRDIPLLFIPRPWCYYLVVITVAVSAVIAWVFHSVGLGATAMLTGFVLALIYEWCHFLMHTDYKPHGRYYRRIYNNHRWHHYRNEHYWFGITSNFGDVVLRTNPDRDAVPVSKTAKNLLESAGGPRG